MENNDLEIRVKRLEQLHVWGISVIAIGLIIYIVSKSTKK